MVFSSLDFLFKFLPAFLAVYYVCPVRWKNICLFVASLIFYTYGVMAQPWYLGLLLLSIVSNYLIGKRIGWHRRARPRKKWLVIGLIYNLSWLFLFKYADFFVGNANVLFHKTGLGISLTVAQLILPIGISFYTFHAISYLMDVYRRKVTYESSFIRFGMYICMFPQLIAGPIVTYSSIKEQLGRRRLSFAGIEDGLREFTIGLGLKVLLANQVSGLWKGVEGIGFESISTPLAWLGLAAYSFQIYFDFYGYSLMAKGLGKMMGFRLPDNFDHPYMTLSMTDFWRKWHMTLGSWFREYVYIPLGGNRAGKLMMIKNMFIVWFLTGFWHGANWNFILWGVILFLLMAVEKLWLLQYLRRWRFLGHAYMLFIIPLTWLVFAVSDLGQMGIYAQRLFPFLAPAGRFTYFAGDFMKYGKTYALSMAASLIFMTGLPRRIYDKIKWGLLSAIALVAIFWLCIYCLKMGADDPFLYFRF